MQHLTCVISSLLHSVNLILFTVLLWFTSSCAYHLITVTTFALITYHSLYISLQTLISFTNPFLHSHSYSFRTDFYWIKGALVTARCTLVQSAVLWSHVVCLSVRPLVNCDHIGWNSSKIISPLVSLGCSLFATPTWRVCSKGNTAKFGPVTHPLLIWALETFDRKLWPNGYR